MTAYAVAADQKGAHHVLAAATVDTVTFAADHGEIEVLSRDGAAEIYFTVDGSTPTVGGTNCFVQPAGVGSTIVAVRARGGTVVKLISAGTPAYSVCSTS